VPVEGWTVQANFGWLDAEYDEFCADINGAAPPAPGQTVCGPVVGDIIPTDNTGLELRRAPEITYALSTTYEWQAGPGFMSVNASYRYKDDYWVAFEPRGPVGVAESHGILDAAIGYDLENFGVRLFGRNLTDEEIENSALFVAGLFTFSTTSVPRTWGVEAVYRFGGDE
jgi:iron complex outermembrane receptor protein